MRALLDVNVLIALLDAAHVHHRAATRWIDADLAAGWASCPITQNGCIRIMSPPSYPGTIPAAAVASRLREAAARPEHVFWPDDVNLLQHDALDWARVLGARQVTDAYLLALALRHGGRLITLDQRIDVGTVIGARAEHLEIIANL